MYNFFKTNKPNNYYVIFINGYQRERMHYMIH